MYLPEPDLLNKDLYIQDSILPKVLILGQTFTTDTGGGITLSNLFRNWPKDKLAVAVESKESVDFSKCANYYRIGYGELKMPFPFSLFQRKTKSGMIREDVATGAVHVKQTNPKKERIKSYIDNIFHRLGLFYWMYGNQKMTSSFLSWVEDFNPDVIYYQPNSYKSLSFVIALKDKVKVPLIAHVMDDWFSFAVKPGFLSFFWKFKLDQKVKKVFGITQLHLSICKYMSEEYLSRYGYQFFPFHNCVNIRFWKREYQIKYSGETSFHILYAGRVGYGIDSMLTIIAKAVENMGNQGKKVMLEIQTKDLNHPSLEALEKYKHVKISKPVNYNALPEKFSEADTLLIPCDFDGPGVKFIRYSMPTKVSEYMATGKPILVIGPPDTALIEYAREGWAQICESKEQAGIEKAISELMSSDELVHKIVSAAQKLAVKNHDESRIIHQFREKVLELSLPPAVPVKKN